MTYPAHGSQNWDGVLQAYIDGGDAAAKTYADNAVATQHTTDTATFESQPSRSNTTAGGLDPTGTTVCASAIQALLDANAANNQKTVLRGTFNLGTNTIYIHGNVDAGEATFNYSGTGVAVQVGGSAYGQLKQLDVKIGHIVYTPYVAGSASWTANTVGLLVTNVFRSKISYQQIANFYYGLKEVGDSTFGLAGVAYNTYLCGTLDNNLVNQYQEVVTGGSFGQPFVNQNTYLGGSWAHADGTYPVSGMRHIKQGSSAQDFDNNMWFGCSLEGIREEYILESWGVNNAWFGCRWEFGSGGTPAPPIWWRSSAARNLIIGGYQSETINQTIDSGAVTNNVIGGNTFDWTSTSTGGLTVQNETGGTSAALSVMPADWKRLGYSPLTQFFMSLRGNLFKMRASPTVDTFDRFSIDASARAITLGSGVTSDLVTLNWGSGTPNSSVTAKPGSIYYDYTNGVVYKKTSGTGNTGWQTLDGEVQTLIATGGSAVRTQLDSLYGSAGHPDVQVFTANGTWTKPSGVTATRTIIIGGGGGGGGGAVQTSGSACSGGAGGGGSTVVDVTFPSSALTSTVSVTVGAGGTSGTAASGGSAAAGGNGGTGGSSSFGSYAQAFGASGGGGGQLAANSNGGAGSNGSVAGQGGNGGTSGAAGTQPGNAPPYQGNGGGSGGGISTAPAAFAGGAGRGPVNNATAGGTAGAINGGAGGAGGSVTGQAIIGGSGGGGGSNTSGNGGAGGNAGTYGSGGGGGGSALTGNTAGAGGTGGAGIVVVISW